MDWSNEAVEALKEQYVETDIPSDTLIKCKKSMLIFTQNLNSKLANEHFLEEEVASKLLRLRKSGKLPTLRS